MHETRAPVLDPGSRKAKTGKFWALARDDRQWSGAAPPGVAFIYAPARGGTACRTDNGMSEAFVKTLKRDYVRISALPDAENTLRQIDGWIEDYNEIHPLPCSKWLPLGSSSGQSQPKPTVLSKWGALHYSAPISTGQLA